MTLEQLWSMDPYSMPKEEKNRVLTEALKELTQYHIEHCAPYCKILQAQGYEADRLNCVAQLPFLPVRLFKEYDLKSVPDEQVSRTMTSSGTTGQQVSKIALDKETSLNQKKTLSHIISSFIGTKRLPLLILDSKTAVKDRKLFGARGAGILGFSIYGHDVTYALDENMNLDVDAVTAFLEKFSEEPMLIFGYTFMIWQHFYLQMKEQGVQFDFKRNAKLFHVGGWKKLKDIAVDNETYKKALLDSCNIDHVYNYYGMAEQLGSIFVECEYGHMHASNFSDIIIRNPADFSEMPIGEKGLMEITSVLPKSYPGHILLTEDEGVILGEDDCPCGRKGKYFKIIGRVKNAELRGCSDTYADKLSRG